MRQKYALNGEELDSLTMIPENLSEILIESDATHEVENQFVGIKTLIPPKGLVGFCIETGLVKVRLSADKPLVKMKVGKLINKTHNQDIARVVSNKLSSLVELAKGCVLKFADTEEEIEYIYENGPKSCMSGSNSVRCYAGPDTAVAFVEVGERIVARTVVVTNEDIGLQWTTIYGNDVLIKPLLTAAGYKQGDLYGTRLLKIEDHAGNILCPYLDCGTEVSVEDDYLELDNGYWYSQNVNGILGQHCDQCGGHGFHNDEMHWSEYLQEDICSDCYSDSHVCVGGEDYHMDSDDIVRDYDGDYILSEEAVYVESEMEYYHCDSHLIYYLDSDDQYYLESDIVEAINCPETESTEMAYDGNCSKINGVWVLDEVVDEYEAYHENDEDDED